MDAALIIYIVILTCALTNFLLGSWWWTRVEKASDIFKCWVVLWGALFYTFSISLTSRIFGSAYYLEIRETWWWENKNLPLAIVSVFVTVLVVYRIYKTWKDTNESD